MKTVFCCKESPPEESRIIYPSVYNDIDVLTNFLMRQTSNKLKTTKYNILTFIPLNLYEQFKRFANIYFIAVVCLNFIPEINSFGKEMAPLPILFVLFLTAVKDGVEDLRRWQSDRRVNHMPCLLYNSISGNYEVSYWQDICPGDFVRISANEAIPADILIFRSSELSGNCYIETANLDGEINLKQRQVINDPDKRDFRITPLSFIESHVEVEIPNREIFKFNGKWVFENDSKSITLKKSNLILRGCVLRNTEFVEGIVIYAGNETKSLLNNNKLTFKRSKLEQQINRDVIWCVIILTILCVSCSIGHVIWASGFKNFSSIVFFSFTNENMKSAAFQGFILFWTCLILFQSIIPLPLYVTIELVKLHQVFHITRDLELYDEKTGKRIQVRATNITEDLGQIQHIFCDKTGTLTENLMEFKRATIGNIDFYDDSTEIPLTAESQSISTITKLLKKFHKKKELDDNMDMSIIEEFLLALATCNTTMVSENKNQSKIVVEIPCKNNQSFFNSNYSNKMNGQFNRKVSSDFNLSIFGIDVINAPLPPPQITIQETFSIPKNLNTPEINKNDDNKSVVSEGSLFQRSSSISKLNRYNVNQGKCPYKDDVLFKFYESESPDETALVKTSCKIGIKLLQRGPGFVCVWKDFQHKAFELDVLCILPFDSNRKRMSVIMMDPDTGIITLYCKGADSSILPIVAKYNDAQVLNKICENMESYSKMGLRTLLVGKRKLNEKVFLEWNTRYKIVEQNLNSTENDFAALYQEMEKDLTLLGATGIEDRLQEEVPECLETLRRAGIIIWVLTGDKLETAINIAYSGKLFTESQEIFTLTGNDQETVLDNLNKFCRKISKMKYLNSNSTDHNDLDQEYGLILEGETISVILDEDIVTKAFLTLASHCKSVVCCRSTPTQKAEIVAMVKNNMHVRTLAIGDGANDVNMIQTAHVGIGIGGKEGMQAVMASDFAITKFKYLRRLLLVHGHRCYDQLARMSLYMFYKDSIIVLVYFWFQVVNGFSGSIMIDQISQVLFNLTMTGLPPLIMGIWDKDFESHILENNPQIYKSGIHLRSYRPRDFWRNIVDSIYQSLVIFWVTYACYQNTELSMAELGILCNTALLIVTYAYMLLESRFWSFFHWFACVGSLLVAWFAEIFLLNSLCIVVFDCNTDNPYKVVNHTMKQPKTYLVLALVSACALFPRVAVKSVLLTKMPSIVYEAQRRLNKLPRSQRDDAILGDLESEKKAEEESSNTIFDYLKSLSSKLSKENQESISFSLFKGNKILPSSRQTSSSHLVVNT